MLFLPRIRDIHRHPNNYFLFIFIERVSLHVAQADCPPAHNSSAPVSCVLDYRCATLAKATLLDLFPIIKL